MYAYARFKWIGDLVGNIVVYGSFKAFEEFVLGKGQQMWPCVSFVIATQCTIMVGVGAGLEEKKLSLSIL